MSTIIKEVGERLNIAPMEIVARKRLIRPIFNARAVVWKVLAEYVHYSRIADAFELDPESVRQCNHRTDDLFVKQPELFDVYDETSSMYEYELKELRELEECG